MRTHTRVYCLALALWVGASAVGAQQQPQVGAAQSLPRYTLVGTVADQSGNPIFSAEVALVEKDSTVRRVQSDSRGRFQLIDLESPEVTLRVRRLGYEPASLTVRAASVGRTTSVFVTLSQSAAALDTVRVGEDEPAERPDPRMIAFNERVATNSFGHYVTPAMLAKIRPQFASDALRELPGVTVKAAVRRVGNTVRLRGCGATGAGASADRVGPLVWLDGVRMRGAEVDDVTAGMDIAAIEVYNSFSGVPVQFFDRSAVCGTILVWTKR